MNCKHRPTARARARWLKLLTAALAGSDQDLREVLAGTPGAARELARRAARWGARGDTLFATHTLANTAGGFGDNGLFGGAVHRCARPRAARRRAPAGTAPGSGGLGRGAALSGVALMGTWASLQWAAPWADQLAEKQALADPDAPKVNAFGASCIWAPVHKSWTRRTETLGSLWIVLWTALWPKMCLDRVAITGPWLSRAAARLGSPLTELQFGRGSGFGNG